eukprot:CAMPEP_0184397110 /NCGR_PEP_ID=MMETSP0007-20130409/58111_1 /TAXON_ID=97485 /ORGANISM="Prymnesium parvum, Strain Texoma1" /LENGTH=30 /DNA_ID= /DNA_START= /DNA_END= /DNA_ORIENTATION=
MDAKPGISRRTFVGLSWFNRVTKSSGRAAE